MIEIAIAIQTLRDTDIHTYIHAHIQPEKPIEKLCMKREVYFINVRTDSQKKNAVKNKRKSKNKKYLKNCSIVYKKKNMLLKQLKKYT